MRRIEQIEPDEKATMKVSGAEHRPTYCQVIDAMQTICAHRQMPVAA
jgi:hypothetical protein